jgi:hypothetical protein
MNRIRFLILSFFLLLTAIKLSFGANDTIQCGNGIGGRNEIVITDSTIMVYVYCLDDSLNNGEFTLKRYEYYVNNKKIKFKKIRKANKTPAIYVPEKFEFENNGD